MSDKIRLAPGQHRAVYDFRGSSFQELGAKLDEFCSNVDYSTATVSGSVSMSVEITQFRAMTSAEPLRTTMGNYFATVDIYRRSRGE